MGLADRCESGWPAHPLPINVIGSFFVATIASSIRAVAVFVVALAFSSAASYAAQPTISMSVGPDESLSYPTNLPSLPDEHTTIFPPAPGSAAYLFFASSSLTSGNSDAVVLQTSDLRTFTFATGYSSQVMSALLRFTTCNPTYNPEFDETMRGLDR